MEEYQLNGREFIPLCDLLKVVGFCESGGQAKTFIAEGLVKVNGETELRKRCKIREGQIVEFNEETVTVVA